MRIHCDNERNKAMSRANAAGIDAGSSRAKREVCLERSSGGSSPDRRWCLHSNDKFILLCSKPTKLAQDHCASCTTFRISVWNPTVRVVCLTAGKTTRTGRRRSSYHCAVSHLLALDTGVELRRGRQRRMTVDAGREGPDDCQCCDRPNTAP